ncbi:MAG: arsenate reductase family protein [Bacilli bacterium]|nr:arsenate reductase family protein [Bacilli bacterium]MBR3209133.1 arsenate reductase family protein [Bacilli bacterium]
MIIIEYPKCSTCKKALKYLDDNKIEYTRRNIVENNPTEEEIKTWIKNNDIEIKKLFNTSGIKYRELNLKEKLKTMSEKEKISLLSTDGMLVKRPILLTKDKILIGFKEDEWKKITR